MDTDPLDALPEKEHRVMDAILDIIESTISDKELREDLCGMIFVTIEEWGKKKLAQTPTDNPQ